MMLELGSPEKIQLISSSCEIIGAATPSISVWTTLLVATASKKNTHASHSHSHHQGTPPYDSKFPALTTALKGSRNSAPQPSPTSTFSIPSLSQLLSLKPRMSLPLTPPPTPIKSPHRKYKKAPPQIATTTFFALTPTTLPPTLELYTIYPLSVPSKGLIPPPGAARAAALRFLIELHRQAHLSANALGSGRPVSFVSPDKRLSPRSSGFRVDCDIGGYKTALERLEMGLEGFLEEGEYWWAKSMLEDVKIALGLLEGWNGRGERAPEKDVKGRPEIEECYIEVLRSLLGSGSGG